VPLEDPGFDVEFLRYVFEWLPMLDASWSRSERRRYRDLVLDLVSVSLSMLPHLEPEQEIDGAPFPFDRWVYELAVRTIVRLGDDESPEGLWRPILELGPKAHRWVESFLSAWMIHGVQAAPTPEAFVRRWREMLSFALSHPSWQSHWRLDELVTELLGANYGRTSIGDDERFAPYLEGMLPLFGAAARRWFSRVEVAQHFAAFLAHPAAKSLLAPGLQWLWNVAHEFDDRNWRWDRLEHDLVEALRAGWHGQSEQIMRNSDLRTAFLGLLNLLASRQNHDAIDLRDRVLSASHTE
jgi:hypothetical protein